MYAPPEKARVTFSGIRWRKLSFRSVKRPKRANRCIIWLLKFEKRSGFVIYSYYKNNTFTAVTRDTNISKLIGM